MGRGVYLPRLVLPGGRRVPLSFSVVHKDREQRSGKRCASSAVNAGRVNGGGLLDNYVICAVDGIAAESLSVHTHGGRHDRISLYYLNEPIVPLPL